MEAAVVWFHPLVWWIGKRLVEERDRACDEAVLQLGNEPQAYAEGILKICKLYVESPLVCVSGVTGSNLKARIASIMRNRPAVSLNLGKKLALAVVEIAALVVPIAVGNLNAPAAHAQSVPDWQTAAGGKMVNQGNEALSNSRVTSLQEMDDGVPREPPPCA